jgi:hypothetical protein
MNIWSYPIPPRHRVLPVSRISPYTRITPYMERETEVEEYSLYPRKETQTPEELAMIDPPLSNYARLAANLIQTALEVAGQATKLLSFKHRYSDEELKAFMMAVEHLKEQMEYNELEFPLLSKEDDLAYLRSDKETIEYWDQKARHVLGISPLELINDDQSFLSYTAYREDKLKTWLFSHQGWIMQTYA